MTFNTQYPTFTDLRTKAKRRLPKLVYDYIDGGCYDENSLNHTTRDIRTLKLRQVFLRNVVTPDITTDLCGIAYNAPFGIAPVGLQGVMWANAPLILAKMAAEYNIPYVLSTVSTASIEQVAKVSDSQALFQLYNPQDDYIRSDLICRADDAGYRAMFVTADMASDGYRGRDMKSGLVLPPKFGVNTIVQILSCPTWCVHMAMTGKIPRFETLLPYMNNKQTHAGLHTFLKTKMSRVVTPEQLKKIRNQWKKPLIVKGVLDEQDIEACISVGIDAVVVSNHGARQLDCGITPISILPKIAKKYGNKIDILFDSGIQSGTDIATALAYGAKFTFAGRAWVYGVGALGKSGASHTYHMLEKQLTQAMTQLGCAKISDLPTYRI